MSTYHLRGQSANMECSVIFLDSSSAMFEINGQSPGSALYDKVINHLNARYAPLIIKRELFGLQYKDTEETTKWLDLNSKLRKQLGGSNGEPILEFRVHFFVSFSLIETLDDCSIKMYFLQLRTMLQQSVLKPRSHDAAVIGALIAQIEIGDFREVFSDFEHQSDYLHQIIIYPDQERKPDLLNRIAEEHKKLKGMDTKLAMRSLVEHVSKVERYGIEIHCAKSIINPSTVLATFERPDTLIEIGVSSEGICVFKNGIKDEQDLAWKHIDKIQCQNKQFILVIQSDSDSNFFKINFTFSTNKNCKACFLSCQAHHQFFQSQLSIEPSTSSSYGRTNTEFLYNPSSILKGRLNIVKRQRRPRRYLVPPEPPGLSNFQPNHTRPPSEAPSIGLSIGSDASERKPQVVSESRDVPISEVSWQKPIPSSHRVSNNNHNPFIDESILNIYPPGNYGVGDTFYGSDWGYEGCLSPRSEGSDCGGVEEYEYEDEDDGYGDVSPYCLADKPDPIQLPNQCNTLFDPLINLEESMKCLKSQLGTEQLTIEFQNAPPLRTDFTVNTSVLLENRIKNRYQDILPYDRSRVILKNYNDNDCGDYINANHLIMILPDNSKLNYIAAQGPLEETITDFWRMVWDQNCSVVVMLTNVQEQRMFKCHPYWPGDTDSVLQCGRLKVFCESPPFEENYVTTREIFLRDSRFTEQTPRKINLLHYTKWPDKKCPENSEDFLDFVKRVRKYRSSFLGNNPLLVHCSAGIGRTGVFIIVETACKLIELNMPVLPLDLVRVLRDQRPYMIQTTEQFIFVCRAIHTFYLQHREPIDYSRFVSSNFPSNSSLNSLGGQMHFRGSRSSQNWNPPSLMTQQQPTPHQLVSASGASSRNSQVALPWSNCPPQDYHPSHSQQRGLSPVPKSRFTSPPLTASGAASSPFMSGGGAVSAIPGSHRSDNSRFGSAANQRNEEVMAAVSHHQRSSLPGGTSSIIFD